MKKHNEGYALVLVLVVMVVMAIVAVTVMGFALKSLKSQQASIERMQSQYETQGNVEIFISQIEAGISREVALFTNGGLNDPGPDIRATIENILTAAQNSSPEVSIEKISWTEHKAEEEGQEITNAYSCTVEFSATDAEKATVIKSTILLEHVAVKYSDTFICAETPVVYLSYEVGGGADG